MSMETTLTAVVSKDRILEDHEVPRHSKILANLVVCSTSFHRSDGFDPETIML